MKRIVVAGCRDYNDYDEAKAYIDMCIEKIKSKHEIVFVSGSCRGADRLGERYAEDNGYKAKGLSRECYIDGIWNKDSENERLTEIQLPIE